MNRVEELTLQALEEGLSPAEEEELNALFKQDPQALRNHLFLLRLESCLYAHGDPNSGCARLTERVMGEIQGTSGERTLERILATLHRRFKNPPARDDARSASLFGRGGLQAIRKNVSSRWALFDGMPASLAACLIIGLMVGAYFLGGFKSSSPDEAIAVLRIDQAGVFLERNGRLIPVEKEMPLLPGDGIRTGKNGKVEIAFSDATRLEVGSESSLDFPVHPNQGGKLIQLNQGGLIATVTKQPMSRPLAIKTSTAEATVIGTEFQLYAKNGSTRLNVRSGAVRFQRLADLTEACVSKGEQSIATRDASRPLSVTRTDDGAFEEGFEDPYLDSRGWYDQVPLLLSEREHISGSRSSAEFRFLKDSDIPTSGNAIRRCFSAAEEVRADYWIKHSPNWSGEEPVGHVMLMTNKNDDWEGTAYTHLTLIMGALGECPAIFVQDGQNIDEARLGQDLTGVTELRAVAGGNGDSDGYGEGVWTLTGYPSGVCLNKKTWAAKEACFRSKPGKFYKGDWRHVQVSVRLNSISNGKAVPDGHLKYWVDGELAMDHGDVVLRTAAHRDMQFDQFLVAPYVTGGSPEEQTLWLDDLTVISDGNP